MVLIFWQGIISIHQKTFLEALAMQPRVEKVMLIAEHAISPYRSSMGWEVPEVRGVEVITSPSKQQISSIFSENKDAIHMMGGVRVGKMMATAFDEGARRGAKMGALAEPYDKTGWKGRLRSVKYRYDRLRYYKHLDFFLAVGREGVKTYTQLGFDSAKIFPWAYFVSVPVDKTISKPGHKEQRLIYAGRIEPGKGILRFTEQLLNIKDKPYTLDIYGGGPDEDALKKLVADNGLTGKIRFFAFLKYDELVLQYRHYDWVVLPSTKKDGWGVIVNEGLLNGLKAICSNICGVSWAIKDNFNGVTFDWADEGSCNTAINKMLGGSGFAGEQEIINWAGNAINAEAGAQYCLQIMDRIYNGKSMPEPPWLK